MNPNRFRTMENNVTQEQIKANILQYNQNSVIETKTERYARLANAPNQKTNIVCESGCALTSQSDVPGPIQTICYDATQKTWNPRQRLNMPTNDYKFPYKGLVSDVTPDPPVLSYKQVTDSSVTLTWTICVPTLNYRVFKQSEQDGSSLIQTTSSKMFVVNGLESGTTYKFFVVAPYANYDDVYSNEVEVTTLVPTPLLKIQSIGYNDVNLYNTNPKVKDAAFSLVCIDDKGVKIKETNSMFVDGLDCDTKYRFYVCAEKNGFYSEKSNTVEAATLMYLPTPNVIASLIEPDKVTLFWDKQNSYFRVFQDNIQLNTINENTYTISSLKDNTTYVFGVQAFTETNKSLVGTCNCKTGLKKPVLTYVIVGQIVNLSWTNYTTRCKFDLYRNDIKIKTDLTDNHTDDINNARASYYIKAKLDGRTANSNTVEVIVPILAPVLSYRNLRRMETLVNKWCVDLDYTVKPYCAVYKNNEICEITVDKTVNDLEPGTKYIFYIVVSNGESYATSNTIEVIVPLNSFTLSSPCIAQDRIVLKWDQMYGCNYNVYQDCQLIKELRDPNYDELTSEKLLNLESPQIGYYESENVITRIDNLTLNEEHSYHVIAYNEYISVQSNAIKVITNGITLIQDIGNTTVSTIGLEFKHWSEKLDEIYYIHDGDAVKVTDAIKNVEGLDYIYKFEVMPDIIKDVYKYQVKIREPCNCSSSCSCSRKFIYSNILDCYLKPPTPVITSVSSTTNSITFTVSNSQPNLYYDVTYKTTVSDEKTSRCEPDANGVIIIGGLDDYTSYKITIVAIDKNNLINRSESCSVIDKTTQPNKPIIKWVRSDLTLITCIIENYTDTKYHDLTLTSNLSSISWGLSKPEFTIATADYNIPNFILKVGKINVINDVESNEINVSKKPPTPSVSFSNVTADSIPITITNYKENYVYKIQYDSKTINCGSPTIVIGGLDDYKSYKIVVTAVDKTHTDNKSDDFSKDSVYTLPKTPFISYVSSSSSSITCKIDNYDNRYNGLVFYYGTIQFVLSYPFTLSFSKTGNIPNFKITYTSTNNYNNGSTVVSNELNVSTTPNKPNIAVGEITTESIAIAISDVDFNWCYCELTYINPTNNKKTIISGESNTMTIGGLDASTKYNITAKSIDKANPLNCSLPSSEVPGTTQPINTIVEHYNSAGDTRTFSANGNVFFKSGAYTLDCIIIGPGGNGGTGSATYGGGSGGGGGGIVTCSFDIIADSLVEIKVFLNERVSQLEIYKNNGYQTIIAYEGGVPYTTGTNYNVGGTGEGRLY